MQNELIEQAASHARPIDIAPASLSDLRKHRKSIKKTKASLLPVESATIAKCDERLADIDGPLKFAKMSGIQDLQIMDTAPFTWRDENGLPKLIPFDVKETNAVEIRGRDTESFSKGFPVAVRGFYGDVKEKLEQMSGSNYLALICLIVFAGSLIVGTVIGARCSDNRHELLEGAFTGFLMGLVAGTFLAAITATVISFFVKERFISARFSGMIPESTRKKIAFALPCFESVFLLAEVPGLKIEKRPVPVLSREGDPLVIGAFRGKFYLIDKFDTTTLEQHVADEFASKG